MNNVTGGRGGVHKPRTNVLSLKGGCGYNIKALKFRCGVKKTIRLPTYITYIPIYDKQLYIIPYISLGGVGGDVSV